MPSSYTQPLDIQNRALWHLGLPPITAGQNSKNAATVSFLYDKTRRRELRRNHWRCATKRAALRALSSTSIVLTPAAWNIATTYAGGYMVTYGGGAWINSMPSNVGNTPGVAGSGWNPYYGPLIATPWNLPTPTTQAVNPYNPLTPQGPQYGSTTGTASYLVGEITYIPRGDGTCTFFQALVANKAEGPYVVGAFDPSGTYARGQMVSTTLTNPIILGNAGIATPINTGGFLASGQYQSVVDLNVGNNPDIVANAQQWAAGTTYSKGDVSFSQMDSQIYVSLVGGNVGNDPFAERFLNVHWAPINMYTGTWTSTLTPNPRATSNSWQLIQGTASTLVIPYPLTAGPVEQPQTRNAYRLPVGFLREAAADPKAGGGVGYLGIQFSTDFDDKVWEDNYIVTTNNRPIILRFIADLVDVPSMDDMFVEGLAAAIAVDAAPTLAPEMLTAARQSYSILMTEARTVNAVETGYVLPPTDSYILVRF